MDELTYYQPALSDIPYLIAGRIGFLIEFGGPQPEDAIQQLREALTAYFTEHLHNGLSIWWIATCEHGLAGIGGIMIRQHPGNFKNLSGLTGYVFNMYTAPGFRRRGICTQLLNRLMDTAKTQGITSFELHATKDGEPVYRKNGFVKHNEPTYRKGF